MVSNNSSLQYTFLVLAIAKYVSNTKQQHLFSFLIFNPSGLNTLIFQFRPGGPSLDLKLTATIWTTLAERGCMWSGTSSTWFHFLYTSTFQNTKHIAYLACIKQNLCLLFNFVKQLINVYFSREKLFNTLYLTALYETFKYSIL